MALARRIAPLLLKTLKNVQFFQQERQIKRWVAPTLMELKLRENKAGGKVIKPRNTFLEWNLEAELYAFAKRLNEDIDSDLLLQAFTDRSYVIKEEMKQKEIEFDLKMKDNIELAEEGEKFMKDYVNIYLETVLPKFPMEGIIAVRNYLISESVLANISLHLGTKDIILAAEYPVDNQVLANTFKAIVGALIKSSGEEQTAHFVRDFVITQLQDKDVNEFWQIENPWEMLNDLISQTNSELEPRLIGEVGKNTLLACYRVGLYLDKKMLSSGFGEKIEIAKEMAAREALKKIFGTQENMYPINLKLNGIPRSNSNKRAPKFKPEVKVVNRPKPILNISSKKEKIEVLSEPIKSVSDKKLYKTIRLENGLTALLISDPSRPFISNESSSEEESSGADESTDQESDDGKSVQSASSDQHGTKRRAEFDEEKLAACALSVGVGSYSDPPDIQGLAHFVEHMVFMGSEKYPKENEFDSFIKKKGGSDNASTDCEVTTFYFEIQEKHLPQAMDIFSQFFVSPLMKKEAMQREREAIESEFAIASPSDANRKDQLLSSLFPDGHPAGTFTWGNLRSLRDDIQDDEKLHKAAHEFRKRHYSAHRMTVAVQARMDLADLEKYVSNTFGQIPTNKLPADDFNDFSFKPEMVSPKFKDIYYMKPVSDTTEIHLTWCMRSLLSEYESKPHQYVSHLLGHEGRGSLLSYLRKKVWALGIYTGNSESGIDYTSMYSLFSVQVVLTKNGLDHVDEVLEAIFSYIQMLKQIGPSEQIYDELKTIEETSFRFEEESQPADYVESLAENMHFFPPEHYITGDKLYYKFDPKGITELLDCMRADMVNVLILSNKHSEPIHYDSKEKWFGTEYKRIEKPKSWLNRWMNIEPYKEFHLPEKNIYITNNFDLVPPSSAYLEEAERLGIDLVNSSVKDIHKKVSDSEKRTKVLSQGDLIATVNNFRLDQPNLLRKNRHMELWYKPDFKFRFPTALLYFYFITPLSLRSPRDACLIDLWSDVLQQGLKEEVYPATMADLSHSLYVSDKGLTLKVSGYSQNLHLLVELVSREMRAGRLTPQLFEAVREVRARTYHNVLIKPHKLAKDVRMNVLLEPYISPRDKAAVIQNITFSELKEYTNKLLGKMYLQVLIQGNLAWHEAITISENVHKNIKWEELSEDEMPEIKVHELPLGEKRVRVASLNPSSTNSIVTTYYQGEVASPKDTATLEVIMMLMEEPAFDALRTKEQLGYSVFSMMRYTFGVLGCSLTVNTQVDKFSVSYVDQRIEAFLKKFARDTRRGGERALAPARRALEQLKHTTDYELKEEVERNWREIVSQEYQFQRLFIEAEAIQQVRIADVKNWIESHFSTGNKTLFRKLSVQIVGNKPKDDNEIAENTEPKNLTLHYLDGSDSGDLQEDETDSIKDIDEFKKNLPIINVPKVELTQC